MLLGFSFFLFIQPLMVLSMAKFKEVLNFSDPGIFYLNTLRGHLNNPKAFLSPFYDVRFLKITDDSFSDF